MLKQKITIAKFVVCGWWVDLVWLSEASLTALLLPLPKRTGEENKIENIMGQEENRDCSPFTIMGKTNQLGKN